MTSRMVALRLPTGKFIVWVLGAFVILGLPATSWIYWPAVGKAGVLSPEADTIIIPMMNSIFVAVILVPVVCVITWLCFRGGKDAGDLLSWNRERPVVSVLVTLCFALPFCFGLFLIVAEFNAPPGWHGQWWLLYTMIIIGWLAVMRGAALTKRKDS